MSDAAPPIIERKAPHPRGFLFSFCAVTMRQEKNLGAYMDIGKVVAICIARVAGQPLLRVPSVLAIAGAGLEGDRYCTGEGSFNKGTPGKRQVTLINARFFNASTFDSPDSRRNITVLGIELMYLIGKEFQIGEARMRGLEYCESCLRPSKLAKKSERFKDTFQDGGGIMAEVLKNGVIRVGCDIISPKKPYE